MFIKIPGHRNAIAYLFWRFILRNNGQFSSWLDSYFFGPSRGINNYNLLSESYKRSDVKPDKQYSILPTVLELVGNCKGKVTIDMGCGAGFFTLPLARAGATLTFGVDNSEAQLSLARQVAAHPNVRYVCADIFTTHIRKPVDIIVAPFVANYARTVPILHNFFKIIYEGLTENGKAIFVIDLPNGKNLRRFGAAKKFLGEEKDEASIEITLFNEEKEICTLDATYFTPGTIEKLLRGIGFRKIEWYIPIISKKGIREMGSDFWKGYTADPELGYFTAEK